MEIATAIAAERSTYPALTVNSGNEPAPVCARAGDDLWGTNWYALRTKPRHEKVVSRNLSGKGYECFLPCWKKSARYLRRRAEWEIALFPGYLFCRFDPVLRLPVLTTPGVWGVVGAGRQPLPIDENELNSLRLGLRNGVSVRPLPFLYPGQTVRVDSGPLAGVEGVVVSTRKPMRVVVSISLLRRSVLLEIGGDCVSVERPMALEPLTTGRQPQVTPV